ncbi:MAG: zinc-ribbon domain-containing protein [Mogibacterium sp.]|nr:zinc-ribbon domain-containing protein [Mogibacterium sp.]
MQARFCSKCGNTIKDGDKFCRKCGSPVRMPGSAAPNRQAMQQVEAPAAQVSRAQANIPSYEEIKKRLNAPNNNVYESDDSHEGTVLLWGANDAGQQRRKDLQANLTLSLDEMLRGCRKVVDFGTGKRYEINIPAGLSPGDKVIVRNTGITDDTTAEACNIELTLGIG